MTMDKIDYSIEENQIEKEDEGNVAITMPFNPNMIKIRRDPFTISELVDKMEHGEIRFDTPFQRKSDLWDEEKQSRLIESLLLKLPLPAFYFDETETDEDAGVERDRRIANDAACSSTSIAEDDATAPSELSRSNMTE